MLFHIGCHVSQQTFGAQREVRWIKGMDHMAQDESTQRGWDVGKMHDVMYSKPAEARGNGMAGCLFTCHVKTRKV